MDKEKEVNELISSFLWNENDDVGRKKLAEGLSKIYGYEFHDESQPTMIENQTISFHGYNPETKKMSLINISPAAHYQR